MDHGRVSKAPVAEFQRARQYCGNKAAATRPLP